MEKNKTAKELAIEKAYGNFYGPNKDLIGSNGLVTRYIGQKMLAKGLDVTFLDNGWAVPTSIKGIEHNNGWIRIESEEYLPKDGTHTPYRVIDTNGNILDYWFNEGMDSYWIRNFTHYKPIKKEPLPIY